MLLCCFYSFKWANLFLSLSLSVLSSNWSLSWIPLYGHFGTQKGILLKLGWIFYWRCWRTFRCCLLIYWKLANVLYCRMLTVLLVNFQNSEFCNQFYQSYFLQIEQEIFAVLTDTFHKPGFKLHVLVLQHLFCLVNIS